MVLDWTAGLRVGVPEIDEQHQELFLRAERLILALKAGDRSEVEPLVKYLSDYVISHFQCEERWMAEAEYPALEPHRDEHRRFRDEMQEMNREYQRKGPTPLMALTISNWLSRWLTSHIGGADVELGRWLQGRGVSLSSH
jgi:hemerythrin